MPYNFGMSTIGIYQDGSQLKIASVSHKLLIERLERPAHYSDAEWKGLLTSGISGSKVLIRSVDLPLKKKHILNKTLPFQVESLTPFSFKEVVVRPVYQIGEQTTTATFFLVPKEFLEQHVVSLEGADPAWVSCVPMALYRFAHFIGKDREGYVIFHVGLETTEVVSITRGMVRHNISIHMGIEQFESAYKKDCPNEEDFQRIHSIRKLSLSSLSIKDYPHLVYLLQEFQGEVDRAFCFLNHKQKETHLRSFLFLGETDTTFQLETWIREWNTFSYEVLPISGSRGYDAQTIKTYAIPIGLALDAIKQDKKSIQFRQGSYIAACVYRKTKRKVIQIVSLCLACAAIIFVSGHVISTQQEKAFAREIEHFIKTHREKIPQLKDMPLAATIEDKVQFLKFHTQVTKSDYHYFSPPPLVADVLAFVSTHPNLRRQEGGRKIVIERLHYELLAHPSIQEPYQSYKVGVTISFTSPELTWARQFHDAIVENTQWIDTRETITWTHEQNAYTLSFVLK